MPYNTSTNTIENMKPYLDELLEGQKVEFATQEPNRFAYYLREAIHAAEHHDVDPYQSLSYTFKSRPGKVIAVPKDSKPPVQARVKDKGESFPGVSSAYQAVEKVRGSKAQTVKFPDYSGDQAPLTRWAEGKGYSIEVDGSNVVIQR